MVITQRSYPKYLASRKFIKIDEESSVYKEMYRRKTKKGDVFFYVFHKSPDVWNVLMIRGPYGTFREFVIRGEMDHSFYDKAIRLLMEMI